MHLQINLVAKKQKPYFLEMNLPVELDRKEKVDILAGKLDNLTITKTINIWWWEKL